LQKYFWRLDIFAIFIFFVGKIQKNSHLFEKILQKIFPEKIRNTWFLRHSAHKTAKLAGHNHQERELMFLVNFLKSLKVSSFENLEISLKIQKKTFKIFARNWIFKNNFVAVFKNCRLNMDSTRHRGIFFFRDSPVFQKFWVFFPKIYLVYRPYIIGFIFKLLKIIF